MINRSALLSDLQKLLKRLEEDLAERGDAVPAVAAALRVEYGQAQEAERTAFSYEKWRSGYATQVAVAWVLGCVFARFLEDNGLVESAKISGVGARLQRARDEHELYFRAHPLDSDREYLLAVFEELGALPGMGAIFVEQNPVFALPDWLSGDAAGDLLQFFQRIDSGTGNLVHDFVDEAWDTRFLGDLYQDLSEEARKRYALLQTPIFVEEFILDRTLYPAIEEFGLEDFRMIDPACGSGHFLLGAFERILDRWQRQEPQTNVRALAQRALDSVHGVDVNPFAVAISRFRLLLAAMKASEITKLKNAPGFGFKLACGDSLLHGEGSQLVLGDWAPMAHHFQTEDIAALNGILRTGYFHAVVANPPYITPKDRSANKLYRQRYKTCHMKYSLAVPFMERLFQLSIDNGFVGQITANSFMKREFGKKLIEEFFPKVNLSHVIDTSGAYIPGHGTPTVILFGRKQAPVSNVIRTVMGIRGEPSTPDNAAEGLVWTAIVNQIDIEGSESEFVSVADSQRDLFQKHPWSIGGGGASELKEQIDNQRSSALGEVIDSIGFLAIIGEDEIFVLPSQVTKRYRILCRPFCTGDVVRDWEIKSTEVVIFPYKVEASGIPSLSYDEAQELTEYLWNHRTHLKSRNMFGKTISEHGFRWYEYIQFIRERVQASQLIAFAFVATHNHFVLDRGGKVFKQSAPVIKLPEGASEDEHLALLGLLNSAIACFWMQQVFHNKGRPGADAAAADEPWEFRFEHDGTKLQKFPLPIRRPVQIPRILDELAQELPMFLPSAILKVWNSGNSSALEESLQEAHKNWTDIRARMIALQEELDWQYYQIYKITNESLTYDNQLPSVHLGQRAFEIVLARQIALGKIKTVWFERLHAVKTTEIPSDWPEEYKQLIQKRIDLIEKDKNVSLLEQFQHKRRWQVTPWHTQLNRAFQTWLLNRLESYFDFDGRMNNTATPTAHPGSTSPLTPDLTTPTLISTAALAEIARQDPDFLKVGEQYRNDPTFKVQTLIDELIDKQTVPQLPVLRYKQPGLRKRADWEHTWNLQRQEDTIDTRTQLPKEDPHHLDTTAANRLKEQKIGPIPVPPKYTTKDFTKTHYWKLRGKLDVPKERWLSFPHTEGPDGFGVLAWAGYDHLQLASAIATYYVKVQTEFGGTNDPRLVPLLASLLELLPWLKQWHNELNLEYGSRMGDYYQDFIEAEARSMGKTLDDIRAWQPPAKAKKTAKKAKSKQ